MGMYTGLRVKAKIKPEFLSMINRLHNRDKLLKNSDRYWLNVINDSDKYDFIREWAKVGRSNFIPFGSVCYLDYPWTEGYTRFDKSERIWEFECSLKNYEHEIETFLSTVLVNIVDELYICEKQYEEDRFLTKYKIEDLKNV